MDVTKFFRRTAQRVEWHIKCMAVFGDSPIIGAGLFVDNEIGAATSTGLGEEVIRICGSHFVIELMRQGNSPQQACELAVNGSSKISPRNLK
ncbi:MAG: isoaspartyl peptidase/L-asparaginase [Cyclobacteriaceae bacterium]